MDKLKYSQLKSKAIELRKKGLSYSEIKKEINVSKSTLSLWLRNIPLNSGQIERLFMKKILSSIKGAQIRREKRGQEIAEIINKAEREIRVPFSFETYQLVGAALYWAEGSKTTHFAITNSDPCFILFMVKWFEKVFGVSPRNLKAKLNIYPQQNDHELKKFWSRLTDIPLENFGKSFIKPPSKNYKKNNLYYGTIRVRVPKGTDMRHRVFGWIKAALKNTALDTELVQKEWKSLKEVPRPVNIPEEIEI